MAKISIITISYNNLEGLKRTVPSVLSQTYNDYEYIVVDGGSNDGSKEYLESKSAQITRWVSEPDKGIYNAMNENLLKKEGYEEMDYAKLDTTRKERTGFAEVVYCARKADEHLLNIYQKLYKEDGEVFGTRASQHQYELVKSVLPQVVYDPVSGILKIEKEKEHIGKVTVCTAGTADISVAEEAAQTAEYLSPI